ncbi:alpha/beta hydrolase [Mycobacterium sp. URHB0021]
MRLLLVHGGFHGPWFWQSVISSLAPLGPQTVELPSVAAKGEPRYGMLDDAAEVRRRLEAIDGPIVVVAGFALDIGESLLDTITEPPPWWNINGDTMTADCPVETFYHDVPAEEADRAVARLRPSSYSIVTDRLTAAAWRDIPSTYVICDQDHAITPAVQEHLARRSTNVRRLPTSHSPMLSRPAEVAQIIAEVMSFA